MDIRSRQSRWFGAIGIACFLVVLMGGCPDGDNGGGATLSDSGMPDTGPDMGPTEACDKREEESCDGIDSDNDGVVDDGCRCNVGGVSVGVCSVGIKQCDGSCSPPESYMEEETGESACDGRDNDCDGTTDEVDPIACDLTQGVCSGSTAECQSNAGKFETCGPEEYGVNFHAPERLCDGMDNDCQGDVDEGCSFSALAGTSADDRLFDADTAPSGALYAVGQSSGGLGQMNGGGGSDFDAFLLKHNADGSEAWIEPVATDEPDALKAVDVGPNGGIVVAGDSFGDVTGEGVSLDGDQDGFVAKYDSDGNRQWITSVRTDQEDALEDVTVLSDGRVALVGTTKGAFDSQQTQTGVDAMIAVLSSDGESVDWKAQLASDQFAYDALTEVSVSGGNIYAVGETEGAFIGNTQASNDTGDMVVAKYSMSGELDWLNVYGRQASEDKPNAATPVVEQGASGIWVAGQTQATVGNSGTSAGEFDGFLVRVDGSGDPQENFNFGSLDTDRIVGLTVATGGDEPEIYVFGESNGGLLGDRGIDGFVSFVAQVDVGSQGEADLAGLPFGTPETTESALVRRGDGGVVMVGYHRQTEFLKMTPTGGEDYFIIEHRPFPSSNGNQ